MVLAVKNPCAGILDTRRSMSNSYIHTHRHVYTVYIHNRYYTYIFVAITQAHAHLSYLNKYTSTLKENTNTYYVVLGP